MMGDDGFGLKFWKWYQSEMTPQIHRSFSCSPFGQTVLSARDVHNYPLQILGDDVLGWGSSPTLL